MFVCRQPSRVWLFSNSRLSSSPPLSLRLIGTFIDVTRYGKKLMIAKAVGVAIIGSACVIKFPTFMNVFKNKSTFGISPLSVYIETLMYSNAASYGILMGYPFSAWGETGIQVIQCMIMCSLIWFYTPATRKNIPVAVVIYALYIAFVYMILPSDYYQWLPRMNYPSVIMSRGLQIKLNMDNGHTGSLAFITLLMQGGGSAVRMFTTIVQIGFDFNMLIGYTLGVTMNSILLGQFFYYRASTIKYLAKMKKPAAKKPAARSRSSARSKPSTTPAKPKAKRSKSPANKTKTATTPKKKATPKKPASRGRSKTPTRRSTRSQKKD